jgi:hypothetical protein
MHPTGTGVLDVSVEIEKANGKQVKTAIDLMFAGVSSDPSSMESLKNNWWQRLIFQNLIGPRMFQGQMDSFVAVDTPGSADILGFLIVQYTGDLAGTFDWGVRRSLTRQEPTAEELEVLSKLLSAGLDWLEEHKSYPHFYFGLMSDSSLKIKAALEEEGLWLPDYQLVQMVAPFPLQENPSMPEELKVTLQLPAQFRARALELMRYDYVCPEDASEEDFEEDLDAVAALHTATLRSAKLLRVQQEDEDVGFIQHHQWKDELRLTLSLKPHLWGTDLERQLVAALPGQLGRGSRRIRLRSFSQQHTDASREQWSSLGFKWEIAPWQRWMVGM